MRKELVERQGARINPYDAARELAKCTAQLAEGPRPVLPLSGHPLLHLLRGTLQHTRCF